MSQRDSGYARKERDLYETPEWVTEALLPHLRPCDFILEPSAGTGRMAEILKDHCQVSAYDIEPHESLQGTKDFFYFEVGNCHCDGIVTNPPYEFAQGFCEHALRLMEPQNGFVAMLLRTDFDHAKSRTHLFRDCPAFSKKLVP